MNFPKAAQPTDSGFDAELSTAVSLDSRDGVPLYCHRAFDWGAGNWAQMQRHRVWNSLHPPASNSVTLMTLEKAKFKCTLRSSLHLCCEWLCLVTLLCPYPACHSGVHDGPASQKPFETGKVNSKHNTHVRGGDAFVSHYFICNFEENWIFKDSRLSQLSSHPMKTSLKEMIDCVLLIWQQYRCTRTRTHARAVILNDRTRSMEHLLSLFHRKTESENTKLSDLWIIGNTGTKEKLKQPPYYYHYYY